MKYKVIKCDICHKDITYDDIRYKFKGYEENYVNFDDFEFNKWTRLDMCERCFRKFQQFVREEKE